MVDKPTGLDKGVLCAPGAEFPGQWHCGRHLGRSADPRVACGRAVPGLLAGPGSITMVMVL